MSLEENLLSDHFSAIIKRIEANVLAAPQDPNRYHKALKSVDDDVFFYLVRKFAINSPQVANLIPDWPPEEVRRGSTGDTPLVLSMLEASSFWGIVKRRSAEIGGLDLGASRVADYGAGWGRIARFAGKDIAAERLYAFEPNPSFRDHYKRCRVPGTLIATDWPSSQSLRDYGTFDIVYCFSILTHSSHELTARVRERWLEITRPGSLVFATIRPKFFLAEGDGDAALLNRNSLADLERSYELGQIVYSPYPGDSGDWGVTVMGPKYLESVFAPEFEIVDFHPIPSTPNQMIVVLKRR